MMKYSINQKRIPSIIGAVLYTICLCTCTATGAVTAKTKTSTDVTQQKILFYRQMAYEITRQCPIALDKYTTLTGLEYKEEEHALAYQYLLSVKTYEEIDEQRRYAIQKEIKEFLQKRLKDNNIMPDLRADRITLLYVYKDKNDKELFTITFAPDEY